MATFRQVLTVLVAVLAAAAVSFVLTPLVKWFAERFGFVDIPKDERRMHRKPIPTIGGLAIFGAFLLIALFMSDIDRQLLGMVGGSLIIVIMGVIDDKYDLNAKLKFVIQIIAALVPVSQGCVIEYITHPFAFLGNTYFPLGIFSIPVTVIWIVAITNALNFIDGLDGLSVGISSIGCLCMMIIALIMGQSGEALLLGALLGACLGFLPYNFNPAKIFMGDTGALFLGYILACMSVSGLFKLYAVISFAVPILTLGVPIIDICFAFFRRLIHHVSPMHPDRSHIHHRLIDSGLNQRQSVVILYAIASLLGFISVVLCTMPLRTDVSDYEAITFIGTGFGKLVLVIVALIALAVIAVALFYRSKRRAKLSAASENASEETGEEDPASVQK